MSKLFPVLCLLGCEGTSGPCRPAVAEHRGCGAGSLAAALARGRRGQSPCIRAPEGRTARRAKGVAVLTRETFGPHLLRSAGEASDRGRKATPAATCPFRPEEGPQDPKEEMGLLASCKRRAEVCPRPGGAGTFPSRLRHHGIALAEPVSPTARVRTRLTPRPLRGQAAP